MAAAPRITELIARKRDGGALSADELRWVVERYLATTTGTTGGGTADGVAVSEAQMAAFLMAGVLRGFTEEEARALTDVFVDSGDRLDLSALEGPTVDKHSTGGVGDGTTLLVAPLLASAGAQVVKLSGRGLGHTGGTLDKLEAIPGFRVDLSPEEMRDVAARIGCVVAAQTDRLVPADRAIYALRDVTGTTPSTGLIASSVMSKKLASGAGSIVLDVKAGQGAFMATEEDAAGLAELCVRIATAAGRRCAAYVTAMDHPLGKGIGNALEVAECVRLLRAAPDGRLAALSLDLAAMGLVLARGLEHGMLPSAREELVERWASGAALERLRSMVEAQGGDPRVCDDPGAVLPAAPVRLEVPAERAGFIGALPAREVGEISGGLGAGRARKGDDVDPAVGLDLAVEVGDEVAVGDPLAIIHARTDSAAGDAAARLRTIVGYRDEAPVQRSDVLRVVG
jgi:pyrimidine-nucleoside phosphorylase